MHHLALLISLFFVHALSAQVSSRNGYYFPVKDTVRILLVFAEVPDDPHDGVTWDWMPGKLPDRPEVYLDPYFTHPDSIRGFITKYFYLASFGKFIVLGDYIPYLVQVPHAEAGYFTASKVISRLHNQLPGGDIITANGLSINGSDFDKWGGFDYGKPKTQAPNGRIDQVMVLWRVNSKLSRGNAGYISYGFDTELKGKTGFDAHSEFVDRHANATGLLRHEFSHHLVGGNDWHTQGGAGFSRMTMATPGGYGILSSEPRMSIVWNAYDRWRLGWKPEGHRFYISARRAGNRAEVNTDLIYGQTFPGGADTFILRDFIHFGDAVRIKLPYLDTDNDKVRPQYLWLENHQHLYPNLRHGSAAPEGIYAYMQLAKDDTAGFGGANNYIWFMSALGNYDLDYDADSNHLLLDSRLPNPFTGVHPTMQPIFNKNLEGRSETVIEGNEIVKAAGLRIDGQQQPPDYFNYLTYTVYGSAWDGFLPGRRIALDANPAPTPLLTNNTRQSGMPSRNYEAFDNRTVHLNGISVEVLHTMPNPDGKGNDIVVRIRWDNFDLYNNVRWCGPIHLHDSLTVKRGASLLLDHGLTPTRPLEPVLLHGTHVFTDPTIFTIRNDAVLALEPGSVLKMEHGSTLRMEPGGRLQVGDSARIVVGDGCTLEVSDQAIWLSGHKAIIEIMPGGQITMAGTSPMTFRGSGSIQLLGSTLTLDQTQRLRMADNTRLVVQRNATLSVQQGALELEDDNCALVLCKGARMQGPPDLAQQGNVKKHRRAKVEIIDTVQVPAP